VAFSCSSFNKLYRNYSEQKADCSPFRCPQWTEDEQLCARNVTNEVHFFDGGLPGVTLDK